MVTSIFLNFHFAGVGFMLLRMGFYIGVLLIVQIFQYYRNDLMVVQKSNPVLKAIFYHVCFYLLIIYGASAEQPFIYFQF